eukprot:c9251_g1_i1.p1 GENE.c9251_g1_i1~~c9251_g1_i1.p1  ORF type:complete len:251 (-),score=67.05 c9251_g1_i1:41-793(-)
MLPEAQTLYERALAIREQYFGADHESVAVVLSHLAELCSEMEETARGIKLLERALEIREKQVPVDNLALASVLDDMIVMLIDQKRVQEAKRLCDRVLRIREEVLGANHPEVARAMYNFARVFSDLSDHETALPYLRRAIEMRKSLIEDTETGECFAALATVLYDEGNYKEAQNMYEKALGIFESNCGPTHQQVVRTIIHLCLALTKQGRIEQAKPLFERAAAVYNSNRDAEMEDLDPFVDHLIDVLRWEQ